MDTPDRTYPLHSKATAGRVTKLSPIISNASTVILSVCRALILWENGADLEKNINCRRGVIKRIWLSVLLTVSCVGCSTTDQEQVLAQNTAGGWLNIDFIHGGSPTEEAQRCVRSRSSSTAVACFAFTSREAYQASQPLAAGNFAGPLCWDARWSRNMLGAESGGMNNARPSSCPPSNTAAPDPAPAEESIAPTGGPVEVAIDFEVERDSRGRLRISGETNLPNETRMSFSLSQPTTNFLAQDSGQVQNGRFESSWFSRQGAPLSAGVYEVGVTVPVYNTQTESVQRRLGTGLEAMTGPLVEQASLDFMGKVASIRREVEVP